jgi:hypothetical protein
VREKGGESNEIQTRRGRFGKSSQALTPEKWEPSVQMNSRAEMAGRANVFAEFEMDAAQLSDLVGPEHFVYQPESKSLSCGAAN